jgi:hypothetical protein
MKDVQMEPKTEWQLLRNGINYLDYVQKIRYKHLHK